jgi:hypothetical protein
MNAQEIVDQLNRIESEGAEGPGHNPAEVWDWIQTLDEWNPDATDTVDPSGAGDRFALKDGTVICWDEQRKVWYEQS